jgi:hypothetical protein
MNNPDHISESLKAISVKILKFFDADPEWKNSDSGSGMKKIRIRVFGMEKIRIRNKHPGSATLTIDTGI